MVPVDPRMLGAQQLRDTGLFSLIPSWRWIPSGMRCREWFILAKELSSQSTKNKFCINQNLVKFFRSLVSVVLILIYHMLNHIFIIYFHCRYLRSDLCWAVRALDLKPRTRWFVPAPSISFHLSKVFFGHMWHAINKKSFHFPLQIYHASEEFGTHDIRSSGGYFHMGNVFFRQGRMDVADTLYRQVSIIMIKWYYHEIMHPPIHHNSMSQGQVLTYNIKWWSI